tara:strand:+ start:569 stop:901 length:333 start_codon:yes stop_codon:yes gene_type:complete
MSDFDNTISGIISQIYADSMSKTVKPIFSIAEVKPDKFEEFKQFAAEDVMKEDQLPLHAPAIQQILNSPTMEHLKAFLHQSGYCDEGIAKLQQSFILDNPDEDNTDCGCK